MTQFDAVIHLNNPSPESVYRVTCLMSTTMSLRHHNLIDLINYVLEIKYNSMYAQSN